MLFVFGVEKPSVSHSVTAINFALYNCAQNIMLSCRHPFRCFICCLAEKVCKTIHILLDLCLESPSWLLFCTNIHCIIGAIPLSLSLNCRFRQLCTLNLIYLYIYIYILKNNSYYYFFFFSQHVDRVWYVTKIMNQLIKEANRIPEGREKAERESVNFPILANFVDFVSSSLIQDKYDQRHEHAHFGITCDLNRRSISLSLPCHPIHI